MAFSTNYIGTPGRSGSIGILQIEPQLTFEQIFSGEPLYYHGSIVQVQENYKIFTRIYDRSIVDRDHRWFSPKDFLGTYQLLGIDGLIRDTENDQGYLDQDICVINRYSYYTITANPSKRLSVANGGSISQCNFELAEISIGAPGNQITASRPIETQDLFRIVNYRQPAALANTEFNQRIGGVGLYLNPGVELNRIEYEVAIINDIYADEIAWASPTCSLGEQNCQDQFNTFAVNYNAGLPINASAFGVYDNLEACQIGSGVSCTQYTFDGTNECGIPYWIPTAN